MGERSDIRNCQCLYISPFSLGRCLPNFSTFHSSCPAFSLKKNSMIPKLLVSVHSVIFQTSLLGKSDEDKNE